MNALTSDLDEGFRGNLWIALLLCFVLFGLGGCGTKTLSGSDPFAVMDTPSKRSESAPAQKTGTPYLPTDDGVKLSPEEMNALMSEGELDRNLSAEDMRDVVLHFKYLVHQGRYTVEKNVERGQFYMPYIHEVLREKNLPRELAYVAFIESGYNPVARSRTGATGMWQFVSRTGKAYGMEQDWWMDERRDPYEATRAAAEYLSKLYQLFNDWHLAITAYNAGEGKISRGLTATGTKNFFELRRRSGKIPTEKDRLTEENMQYLPKFLAVCKIMRNLDSLGFSRMDMSRSPKVVALTARPGTDLMALSKSAGLSWDEFYKHNPAYQRYVSPPGRATKVYVPYHAESKAREHLRKAPTSTSGGWKAYTVARGDTMTSVSRKTGVPVAELRRFNQVSEPLKSGKTLKIPGSGNGVIAAGAPSYSVPSESARPVASKDEKRTTQTAVRKNEKNDTPSTTMYEVKTGDTVYSIASRHGLSPQELLTANGMPNPQLKTGQKLAVPKSAGKSTPQPVQTARATPPIVEQRSRASSGNPPAGAKKTSASSTSSKVVTYRVQEGDSLWAIARKFNMPPMELLSLNNLDRAATLRPGDTVRVAAN